MTKSINPTLYVIINKSLNMNPGKVSAQVAHAVSGMFSKLRKRYLKSWSSINPRTVVILECENADYMQRFSNYLSDKSIRLQHFIYTDESSDFQITTMAIEPVNKFDPRIELIFGQFKLYTYGSNELEEGY